MRPSILFPLFAETRTLAGRGPEAREADRARRRHAAARSGLRSAGGIIDRSYRPRLNEAEEGRIATVEVNVPRAPAARATAGSRTRCAAPTTRRCIELVFFHAHGDYLSRQLPVGARRIVSGQDRTLSRRGCRWRIPITSSRRTKRTSLLQSSRSIGLTEGLPLKSLSKAVRARVGDSAGDAGMAGRGIPRAHGWPAFRDARSSPRMRRAGEADLSPRHAGAHAARL